MSIEYHVGKMKSLRDSCARYEYVNTTKLCALKWLRCRVLGVGEMIQG